MIGWLPVSIIRWALAQVNMGYGSDQGARLMTSQKR